LLRWSLQTDKLKCIEYSFSGRNIVVVGVSLV